jgi:outer membrane protein assembly factor BamB
MQKKSWNGTGRILAAAVAAAGLLIAAAAPADDWPQWLGPNRDGVSHETGWQWPADGPRFLWRVSLGQGYSAVAVVGERLFTMGNDGSKDIVWCLDVQTGREVWKYAYPCKRGSYPGPRMTPTVHEGLVYTLSRDGDLFCFDATSGAVRWSHNVQKDFGVRQTKYRWGLSCSPLVLGERLILDVGKVLAFDRRTGRLLWQSGSDEAGFSSPVALDVGGRTLVTGFTASALVLVDAADGREVARHEWTTDWAVNAATPVVQGDRLFISSGYKTGCGVLRVTGGGLAVVYRNKEIRNHCSNSIPYKGFLYGIDGQMGGRGDLVCLDFATGEAKWRQEGFKAGGLTIADGRLLIQNDGGDLILAEASPAAYREIARAEVLSGQCWTHPVLSNGRIYCRSHDGELVCLDVRK